MNTMIENLKEKLRENGYKMTPQRRAILEVIADNPGKHLSTEEIYEYVKADNQPDIGLATVYRTLILFVDLNMISKIHLDDGLVRYEMMLDDELHQHHHLICGNCGEIIEVMEDWLDKIEERIEKLYQFKITDHKLIMYGICKNCRVDLNE